MSALDLSTPEATREYLQLCLTSRVKRTPEKLAEIIGMREWLRGPLHQHAPHLASLHAEAERLRVAADRAQQAYVQALATWIYADSTANGGE